MNGESQLMSASDAARSLKITTHRVGQMVDEGKLRVAGTTSGGRVFWRSDVEALRLDRELAGIRRGVERQAEAAERLASVAEAQEARVRRRRVKAPAEWRPVADLRTFPTEAVCDEVKKACLCASSRWLKHVRAEVEAAPALPDERRRGLLADLDAALAEREGA